MNCILYFALRFLQGCVKEKIARKSFYQAVKPNSYRRNKTSFATLQSWHIKLRWTCWNLVKCV